MHNSDSIISFASTISNLVGVFKSLSYIQNLEGVALLNQALGKLPLNIKESWALHTVKKESLPTIFAPFQWLAGRKGRGACVNAR